MPLKLIALFRSLYNNKNSIRTYLSSMPWLRLSFILTITSRGCSIFLSPLHFGVVTLPRECTYVRHKQWLEARTGISIPYSTVTKSTSLYRLWCFTHTQFNSRQREHRLYVCTNELGVLSLSRIVICWNFRDCRCTVTILSLLYSVQFSGTPAILIFQILLQSRARTRNTHTLTDTHIHTSVITTTR